LRDQEHRFVAKRLLKDATDMMDQLEKRLKETAEVAAPLASDKAEDFAGAMYLQHVADALKAHMKTTQKSSKVIFDEMSEQKDSVVVERFVSFVGELPGVKASEDDGLSEEQLKAAYDCLKGREEQLSERAFLDQLRTKFICASVVSITDELKLKEGKTVRKLELNEIVEALEEPVKDETVDLMRVKVKAEKDDKEGYITLAGNQGTRYLEPYSPFAACKKVVELRLKQLADKAREVGKYIEQKGEELKSVRTGPLAETKSELLQMRPRVSKVKAEHEELKKRVAQADKKQAECMEAERRRRKEAADRRAAAALTCEAEQMVSSCQETVEEAVSAAKALEDTRGSEEENPIAAIAKVERVLEAALQGVDAAGVKIKAGMDEIKAATEGPLKDARATLIKLKVRVGALESKCKAQQLGLQRARKQVASDAHEAVTRALQLFVRKAGKRPDEVFTELSQGGQEVPVDELRKFVGGIPDHGLKAAQLELGLERYAGGVTRLTLLELLQEFKRCVKDIAITTAFEVKDSKTLRKLAVGELIEVLEADRADKDGIARVRCRALSDQKEGWATLRGNQGTAYMVKAAKPYYWCQEDVVLQSAFASSSSEQSEVRKLQAGEVVEVLEGPRKEPDVELQRVKVKAKKDGKSGWATLTDPQGTELLEPSKLLVCRQSIAITTNFDIAAGKAIRKLDVGETLEVLEGPSEDGKRSLSRFRARASLDGKEGWVTMRGNQGTAYTEESENLRVCKRSLPLEGRLAGGSPLVRRLEVGEVVEVIEGPKSNTKEGVDRLRGRSLADSAEGWLTLSGGSLLRWSPQYKCTQTTVLNDKLDIKQAKTLRKLEVGELIEALETPVPEKAAGVMRVRMRAEKDGALGFATVSGNRGTVFLKPVLDE